MAGDLQIVREVFEDCLRCAAVFERKELPGGYFEADEIRKDGKPWLVVAAGLSVSEARNAFSDNAKKAERATSPLRFGARGRLSFLFLARAAEAANYEPLQLVVPFDRTSGVSHLELRDAHLRIFEFPSNEHGLQNLRWEWNASGAAERSMEPLLRELETRLGFNPAHPPSHLHINSGDPTEEESARRPADPNDLHLSVGAVNPLSLILSLATWLRRIE
ncbi:MAG: hypothetical protein NTW86_06035 [Candidatus Sumerlaeota bacterium]|nr:hypothetical protein [Candidatus Sumerlaeota bacterium]